MLENQVETEQTVLDPALQRRVTPDEFSAAVIAIQKRKAEKERILSETVQVDEVVRDLNIDATPEEILAEVESLRKSKSQPKQTEPPQFVTPTQPPVVAVPVSQPSVMLGRQWRMRGRRGPRGWIWSIVGVTVAWYAINATIGPVWKSFLPSHPEIPLTSLAPGHPETITNGQLNSLLHGTPPSEVKVITGEDVHAAPWTIINLGGKDYIWAYADDPLPANYANSPVTIYNDMNDVPTDEATRLTIPVSSLMGGTVGGTGDDGTVSVSKLTLDSHQTDDWDNDDDN